MTGRLLVDLADACRASGLTVLERPGWATRGHGLMAGVRTIVCHHTAGPTAGDAPSLTVVERGRPDLAGPLAHLFLARSGVVYVVAAGLCWHAGTVLHPEQGNQWSIGIEAEATGTAPWPDVQYRAYVQLCRALADHYELAVDRVLGHKEVCSPPGRKVDPAPMDMDRFRADVARLQMGAPMAAGGLPDDFANRYDLLDRDLRADLHDKALRLDRIEQKVDQLLARTSNQQQTGA